MTTRCVFIAGLFLCAGAHAQEKKPVDTILKPKKELQTVTVTGRKPLVTRKADRYIINVENSLLANGNTGLEVLQKSPGIWVDAEGGISIKGGQPVTVMINDVVQRMSGEELAEYLKTLRSEDISRIEVISNPQAEFEAAGSGGIVHIILKRSRKDGYNGSLSGQYRQQRNKPYYSAGGSINYKANKLYLNGGYTFARDIKPVTDTAYLLFADGSRTYNHTGRIDDISRMQWRAGIGYDLAADQYIEIQHTGSIARVLNTFHSSAAYYKPGAMATGATDSDKHRRFAYTSTTLNYQYRIDSLGSKLTIIGEYTGTDKGEITNFYEYYSDLFPDNVYRTHVPFTTNVYSAQINYTKQLKGKTTIGTGIKYVGMDRDNEIATENYSDSVWTPNPGQSNRFIYKEQLMMGFASVEQSIKKTTIKAGLRVERTGSAGNAVTSGQQFERNYVSVFPSVLVMYKLNAHKENSIYLSYTKRIQRPAMNELNPARYVFNNYTVLIGNPNLKPQYTHTMEAGFNFLYGYSVTVYAAAANNVYNMMVNQGADNSIQYEYQNFGKSLEYGSSVNTPVTVCKWYAVNNGVSLFHLHYNLAQIPDRTTFSVQTEHTLTLEKWCDVQLRAYYRSPVVYPGWRNPNAFHFDMEFSKKVMKKQGRLKLYFNDLFNTQRDLEITDTGPAKTTFYRKRTSRTVSLSFTYNFSGGQKFNNRKIESIGGDEKSRAGS